MELETIDDAIEELENSDTTVDNVAELASLYIVREHLAGNVVSDTEKELNDILPNYKLYIGIKRKYQLGQCEESEVIHAVKSVCKELKEFLETLYYSTDMNKERICIRDMLNCLNKECSK